MASLHKWAIWEVANGIILMCFYVFFFKSTGLLCVGFASFIDLSLTAFHGH